MSSDHVTDTMVENFNELTEDAQFALLNSMITTVEEQCAQLQKDFSEIRVEQSEIRAEQAEIRVEQSEIRAEFQELCEQIDLEMKYAEEDHKFFKNLNLQMDACLKA